MKPRFVFLFAATAAASALVALPSTQAQRDPKPTFDALFAAGGLCAPAQAGRPPLLGQLVLAQAETRPFQPGQQPPAKVPPAKSGPPPLYDNLGTLHVPVTTKNPKAQAYFDQGMRLTFAFNHAEAARAFRAAQALDPGCAMCYWGEALVLGPNINAPMFPEAVAPAVQAAAGARMLARQIPGAGHIVHMPSHIYYRLGMYREALQSNVEAVAVDEQYFSASPSDPVYRGAYYPHNIHFVMVSALMGGDGKTTLDAASKLDKAVPADAVKAIGALQPVKSAPYFAHVQFSSPDVLVSLPDPGPEFVLVKAMWHYARAIGFVRKGAADAAKREVAAIERIERSSDFKPLTDWAIPGREIVRTARAVARGRVADLQGKLPEAIAAYREAVAIQDALPYMEPPYWYYPVRQSLGVALLRAGQLDQAEQVFRISLARTPSNGWALRGLMEVYRVRGDSAALAAARLRFTTTWLGKPEGPALSSL